MSLDTETTNNIILLMLAVVSAYTAWETKRSKRDLSSVKKTGEATHKLSNSARGAELQVALDLAIDRALFAHRLADVTRAPGDIAAATAADVVAERRRQLFTEHVKQQAGVDADEAAARAR